MLKDELLSDLRRIYDKYVELSIEHQKVCETCINRQKCDEIAGYYDIAEIILDSFE